MSVGTPLGDMGDTLLFATRFATANDVDAAFETLMGDDKYQEMAAGTIELAQSIQDRFLMLLAN